MEVHPNPSPFILGALNNLFASVGLIFQITIFIVGNEPLAGYIWQIYIPDFSTAMPTSILKFEKNLLPGIGVLHRDEIVWNRLGLTLVGTVLSRRVSDPPTSLIHAKVEYALTRPFLVMRIDGFRSNQLTNPFFLFPFSFSCLFYIHLPTYEVDILFIILLKGFNSIHQVKSKRMHEPILRLGDAK